MPVYVVCQCSYRPGAVTQANPSGAEYLYLCESSNLWVRSEWLADEFPTRELAQAAAERFPRVRPFVDEKYAEPIAD